MCIWNCPVCFEELGELNGWCEYCKAKDGTIVYNPNKYFIRDIRIDYIISKAELERMTPQEELFSKLFNHEKALVKDMDVLTLRAHREDLSKIAFEARARLTAVDDEEKTRKKVKNTDDGKPKGFARSVNADDTATEAINAVKERQKRLSKADKIRQSLVNMGVESKDIDSIMSAKNILGQVNNRAQNKEKPLTETEKIVKPVFNPFEKK